MTKEFIVKHLDEIADALKEFDEYMIEDFEDLKFRALDGIYEIAEAMQFCMDKTNDVCEIPFCSRRTNQMMYDYRTFFEHGEKLGKLYKKYHEEERKPQP